MNDYTPLSFDRIISVNQIITLFYMELSKHFYYEGEQHDFWEMVYIDKGEMICTADEKRFTLKSGEMTFHKPNEYHNLSGNNSIAPNIGIITFQCKSKIMKHLEGKIFRLNPEEKALLSMLFSEGLSCFRLEDEHNPLIQRLHKIEPAPLGSSQITKNLLEIFLVKLCRHTDAITKQMRQNYVINDVDVPYNIKEILDFLDANLYGKLTIKDIADAVGKSESTVKQLFATWQKGGIIRYYNARKIKEARKLIRENNHNITQISDLLHFDNPRYFSKCFKDFTNMSPSEYRASINKQLGNAKCEKPTYD